MTPYDTLRRMPKDDLIAYAERLELALDTLTVPTDTGVTDRCLRDGEHLTQSQRRILSLLLTRPGATYSRDAILAAMCFDEPSDWPSVGIVDVQVCKLRPKLDSSKLTVRTVWGVGYAAEMRVPAEKVEA